MFNRKYLFELLKNSPFGGTLTQAQVTAIGLILDASAKLGLPLQFIAYIIATAFHETGGKFTTGKESLNYTSAALRSKFSRARISLADADKYGRTDKQKANQSAIANLIYGGAWGLANLGNRLIDDGWRFIGRGLVQITGRRNYEFFGVASNPDDAMKLETAVRILVEGMVDGVFTGRKLAQYQSVDGGFNAVDARAVVNGSDKASLIAMHYEAILAALTKAEVNAELAATGSAPFKAALLDTSEIKVADIPAIESPIVKTLSTVAGTGAIGSVLGAMSSPWALLALVAILVVGGVLAWGILSGRLQFNRA